MSDRMDKRRVSKRDWQALREAQAVVDRAEALRKKLEKKYGLV